VDHTPIAIDTHTHPISPDRERYPLRAGRENSGGWATEMPVSTGDLLAAMDRCGVHGAVLVQSANVYGFENSYVADGARENPGRCVAICAIDMLAPDAPDTLTHWVKERGVRGMRVTNAETIDDEAAFPVWERARELGIPVDLQLQPAHLGRAPKVIERFADVPVLIDHAGNANKMLRDGTPVAQEPPETLLALAKYPNVYLKLTTQNVDGAAAAKQPMSVFLQPLVDTYGARRLMWGTDFPATANERYEDRIAQMRDALSFLSAEDQRWILGESALQVWPELRPW
jgi:predicted TIM-barrel fold metal-dependent hydrolase